MCGRILGGREHSEVAGAAEQDGMNASRTAPRRINGLAGLAEIVACGADAIDITGTSRA